MLGRRDRANHRDHLIRMSLNYSFKKFVINSGFDITCIPNDLLANGGLQLRRPGEALSNRLLKNGKVSSVCMVINMRGVLRL